MSYTENIHAATTYTEENVMSTASIHQDLDNQTIDIYSQSDLKSSATSPQKSPIAIQHNSSIIPITEKNLPKQFKI